MHNQKKQQEYLESLLYKYNADKDHALQVQKLSLMLYDQLKEDFFPDYSDKRRNILQVASLLHDIGYFIEAKSHNKHSAVLIQRENFSSISSAGKEIIACIARYHRGSLPKKEHDGYRFLSEKYQHVMKILAGIVRLADGLDRAHLSLVEEVKAKYNKKNNILWVRALPKNSDFKIDISHSIKKKDLLEKSLNVQLVVIGR